MTRSVKVATQKASTHSTARNAVKSTPKSRPKRTTIDLEAFEIDPELLDEGYNQTRRPLLPYGIVINDNPAGILIPVDQLEKADWLTLPDEDELTTVAPSDNEITGLLFTQARFLVLGFVPEYIRYKSDEGLGELAGTTVGLYDEYRNALDKKTMEVCSEHALVFLDEQNQPLHTAPIVVRFRNVALWSFKSAREEYYRQLEKTFADYCKAQGMTDAQGKPVKFSGKTDKWRSLGVLEVSFKAEKEGEGKNKHFCCKTQNITAPTADTLPQLFLGTAAGKSMVWQQHDAIAGFTEQTLPALPAEADAVATEVLPASPSTRKLNLRSAKPAPDTLEDELEDEDFLDIDAEDLDDDDDDLDFEEDDDD